MSTEGPSSVNQQQIYGPSMHPMGCVKTEQTSTNLSLYVGGNSNDGFLFVHVVSTLIPSANPDEWSVGFITTIKNLTVRLLYLVLKETFINYKFKRFVINTDLTFINCVDMDNTEFVKRKTI